MPGKSEPIKSRGVEGRRARSSNAALRCGQFDIATSKTSPATRNQRRAISSEPSLLTAHRSPLISGRWARSLRRDPQWGEGELPVINLKIVVAIPTLRIMYANDHRIAVVGRRLLGDVHLATTLALRDDDLHVTPRYSFADHRAALIARRAATEGALVETPARETNLEITVDVAGPTKRGAIAVAAIAVAAVAGAAVPPAAIRAVTRIDTRWHVTAVAVAAPGAVAVI